jgi:hypothetical protein
MENKKVTIECTESEAQLISKALDFYCRMGLGQFNYLTDNETIDKIVEGKEDFNDVVKSLKTVYTGMSPNASFGIFSEQIGNDCKIAAHLHQEIRHEFWKDDKNPEKPKYSVTAYPADICQLAEIAVPEFKMVIKND